MAGPTACPVRRSSTFPLTLILASRAALGLAPVLLVSGRRRLAVSGRHRPAVAVSAIRLLLTLALCPTLDIPRLTPQRIRGPPFPAYQGVRATSAVLQVSRASHAARARIGTSQRVHLLHDASVGGFCCPFMPHLTSPLPLHAELALALGLVLVSAVVVPYSSPCPCSCLSLCS